MRSKQFKGTVTFGILLLFISISHAQSNSQDVYWHIDPNVKTCSMVIDASLTQAQWHKFTKQGGAILSFKSLATAKTLGKMNFKITIDHATTPVNQHDPAWINTFTHPDENCPLGDVITIPTIRAHMGITDNMDIGAYWTVAPGANYGGAGGELKYALSQESGKFPAMAGRVSFSALTGVPDFNVSIYSIEFMGSKKIIVLTPYIGLRENLFIGTEKTSKVDLNQERLLILQGYGGISYSVWMFDLVAEYNVSSVNTFAFAIGFNL